MREFSSFIIRCLRGRKLVKFNGLFIYLSIVKFSKRKQREFLVTNIHGERLLSDLKRLLKSDNNHCEILCLLNSIPLVAYRSGARPIIKRVVISGL